MLLTLIKSIGNNLGSGSQRPAAIKTSRVATAKQAVRRESTYRRSQNLGNNISHYK